MGVERKRREGERKFSRGALKADERNELNKGRMEESRRKQLLNM